MLARKATSLVRDWSENNTGQALLVMGARQVGKTTLVRSFAAEHFDSLLEVNFYDNPLAVKTVNAARDARDFFLRLSALGAVNPVPGKTLVFLDEVQECEDSLTWIKFLAERTGYDFVLSGSLLGLEAFPARSLPVGFLQTISLYPLDFEEFCLACGVSAPLIDEARGAFCAREEVPDYLHDLLTDTFYKYLLTGGMPDPVQAYVSTNSLPAVRNAQRAIVELYHADIAKYVGDRTEARQIRMVFDAIPSQASSPNKRFKYTRLGRNLRYANLETAFDWLEHAGVAIPVPKVSEPVFPLGLSEDRSSFKLFSNDVGLFTAQLFGDVDLDILARRTAINYGAIFESYAAQELLAHGYEPRYYQSRRLGELDYVLQDDRGDVFLCEMKSGKDYRRHSALNNLLATENYAFRDAYVFYDGNVRVAGSVTYLPAYMVAFL